MTTEDILEESMNALRRYGYQLSHLYSNTVDAEAYAKEVRKELAAMQEEHKALMIRLLEMKTEGRSELEREN